LARRRVAGRSRRRDGRVRAGVADARAGAGRDARGRGARRDAGPGQCRADVLRALGALPRGRRQSGARGTAGGRCPDLSGRRSNVRRAERRVRTAGGRRGAGSVHAPGRGQRDTDRAAHASRRHGDEGGLKRGGWPGVWQAPAGRVERLRRAAVAAVGRCGAPVTRRRGSYSGRAERKSAISSSSPRPSKRPRGRSAWRTGRSGSSARWKWTATMAPVVIAPVPTTASPAIRAIHSTPWSVKVLTGGGTGAAGGAGRALASAGRSAVVFRVRSRTASVMGTGRGLRSGRRSIKRAVQSPRRSDRRRGSGP